MARSRAGSAGIKWRGRDLAVREDQQVKGGHTNNDPANQITEDGWQVNPYTQFATQFTGKVNHDETEEYARKDKTTIGFGFARRREQRRDRRSEPSNGRERDCRHYCTIKSFRVWVSFRFNVQVCGDARQIDPGNDAPENTPLEQGGQCL